LADVQRIVIELSADTTELQPAIDQLEALGQIDAKSAELFKKTNAAINERAKTLATVNTAQKAVTEGSKQTAASYEKLAAGFASASKSIAAGASSEVVKGFFEGVQDALEGTGLSVEEFEQKLGALKEGGLENFTNSSSTLLTELKKLKDEMARIDPNSARFAELSQEAADLQNSISNVNKEVKNLASDTATLDGVIGSIQGVAGAFQVVEGSAALFGDTSKELQETLVRLTALMNITNGLQGIQNLLQRQSAATLLITNAQRSISASLIALEGAAESKNIVIRYAAVAAQKLLNAVMAANPAGLLVVALGALASALLYFSDSADSAAEAQIKLNEAQLESLKVLQQLEASFSQAGNDRIKILESELTLAKARGANVVELAKLELDIANAKKAQALASAAFFADERNSLAGLQDDYQKQLTALEKLNEAKRGGADNDDEIKAAEKAIELTSAKIALEQKLRDAVRDTGTDQQAAAQNLTNAQKDAEKARLDALEKERAANRAAQLQKLQDEKAFIETSLIEVEKGTEAELNLKLALIQKEAEIGLFSLEGTKNTEEQRLLIIAQAGEKAKEIKLDAEREVIAAIYAEQEKLNNVDQNKIAAQLAATEQGTLAELQLKKDAIEAIADAEKLAAQKKFQDSKQSVTDQQVFATEIVKIDAEATKQRDETDEEYRKRQAARAQEALDQEQAVQDQMLQSALGVLNTIGQASAELYQQERATIQSNLEYKIEALNEEKDKELSNRRLTAKQKEEIEEKYRKKEAALKLQAWQAQQDAAESQALIQGALAFVQTLASIPFPYNLIAAAGVAALTAIQIDGIRSQSPPKFKDGTEYVKGPGTSRSDSVHAMLSVGERVFSAETSAKYAPALNKIQRGQISPEAANSLLNAPMMEGNSFRMKPVTQDMVQQSIQFTTGKEMDYKKAAKAYAEEQWSDLDNLNDSMIATRRSIEKEVGGLRSTLTSKAMESNPLRIR